MLDLYGVNHDIRDWERPQEFCPDRFKEWKANLFQFVPQGLGDHLHNHRCPGELLTIEIMRTSLYFFCNKIQFEVPAQNLCIKISRLPALPHDHFKIKNVRRQLALDKLFIH